MRCGIHLRTVLLNERWTRSTLLRFAQDKLLGARRLAEAD